MYRLVKDDYVELRNGEWQFMIDAFRGGRGRRISVDRARKCNNDPRHTQEVQTDYICKLDVEKVRSIDPGAKIEGNKYHYQIRDTCGRNAAT